MAKYAITRSKKKVNRNFQIPPGVEDMEYEDEAFLDDYISDLDDDSGGTDVAESPVDDTGELEVPEILNITQTKRIAPGGQIVIDLTIEVEDVEDTVKYDVGVAKE